MKILMILLTLSVFTTSCGSAKKTVDHMKTEVTSHSKLDDVIRGEKAAVETYTQVIGKVEKQEEKKILEKIRDDHKKAIERLQKYANAPVKEDSKTSGAWGTFAEAWTGGAKLFGDKAAVKALKQGEEHGIEEYNQLLNDEKVSADLKEIVRSELIPQQKQHIKTLESKI
jgi:uncharacterized protein YbjQ (UPF0145 family)